RSGRVAPQPDPAAADRDPNRAESARGRGGRLRAAVGPGGRTHTDDHRPSRTCRALVLVGRAAAPRAAGKRPELLVRAAADPDEEPRAQPLRLEPAVSAAAR